MEKCTYTCVNAGISVNTINLNDKSFVFGMKPPVTQEPSVPLNCSNPYYPRVDDLSSQTPKMLINDKIFPTHIDNIYEQTIFPPEITRNSYYPVHVPVLCETNLNQSGESPSTIVEIGTRTTIKELKQLLGQNLKGRKLSFKKSTCARRVGCVVGFDGTVVKVLFDDGKCVKMSTRAEVELLS